MLYDMNGAEEDVQCRKIMKRKLLPVMQILAGCS